MKKRSQKTEMVTVIERGRLHNITPYMLILPSILIFILCYLFPICYMGYLSFFKWDMLTDMEYVGFRNFLTLFGKEEFHQVLKNTFTFTFVTVGVTLCFATVLSVWLNHNTRIHKFVQAAIFSPHIIALVSVAFVWMWMMDPRYGLLNYIAEALGLPTSKWLQSPDSSMRSLIITSVWKLVGYDTLILISALQSIPTSIYEAAELDDAPKMITFFKITVPMVSPSLFFLLVMNTLSMFQNFDTVAVMTQGGPLGSTNTLVYYIYQNAFSYYKLGYASAAGTVLTIIVGILTIIYFKLLGNKVHYQ